VRVRTELSGQAVAAVVAGVEYHDDHHRHRQAKGSRRQGIQASRQMGQLVVSRNDDNGLLERSHHS
jgi:hypothetical protein